MALASGAVACNPATLRATHPSDGSTFHRLERPDPAADKYDETSFSGFEFLISSRSQPDFRANDQYLVSGEQTVPGSALADELGPVGDLSGTPFGFTIEHVPPPAGRRFVFSLKNEVTGVETVQCWGVDCPAGSNSDELVGGKPPLADFDGLQISVRAQEVAGSSATLEILGFDGPPLEGAPLFDETVTPDTLGTIDPLLDRGRRVQWILADGPLLSEEAWRLRGRVVLVRSDPAQSELTKVRVATDLVRQRCGLGAELVLVLLPWMRLRARRARPRPPTSPV